MAADMQHPPPPGDATPARSRIRRIARLTAIAVAVSLLLVAVIVIGLHTPPGKRFVLSNLTTLLADQQIGLDVRGIDYNLLDLSVMLQDVTIRSAQVPEAPPFARIPRARVDLSLLDLICGRYVLEEGAVEGPTIHLVVDESGRDNLPPPPTQDADPDAEPIDYLIEDLAVSNATIRYQDERQPLDIVLPITSIDVQGQSIPATIHRVEIAGGGGSVTFEGREAPIEKVTGNITYDGEHATFEPIRVLAAGAALTVTGEVTGLEESPIADLLLDARIDAEQAAALAGVTERLGGTATIEAAARGPIATPAIQAEVEGSGLFVRGLRNMQVTARGAYDVGARAGQIERLQWRSPFGLLSATGSVALDGASRVDAELEDLNLGEIGAALDLPYAAASRVDGVVDVTWPGLEYLQARGDAQLTLTPTRARAAAGVAPIAGAVGVQSDGSRIVVVLRDLRSLGVTADGRVSLVDRRVLDGRVTARSGNVGNLVSAVESFLGRPPGTLLTAPVAGAASVEANLGGTLTEPSVSAALRAPALSVGGASGLGRRSPEGEGGIMGVAVTSDIRYSPAAVVIDGLAVTWQQAALHASGRVGLQGQRSLALDVDATNARIESVLAAVNRPDIPASGTVSLAATVGGTLDNPSAAVALSAEGLTAYREAFGDLTANAQVAGRQVTVTQLRLEKPQPGGDGLLTATGSYDLDRERFTLAIDSDGLQLVSLTLPDGTPIRGTVELDARGEGTRADPMATAQLVIDGLRVDQNELGRVALDVDVADRHAAINGSADRFGVMLDAQVGTSDPYPTRAALVVDGLDLAALPLGDNVPLMGSVEARATGTLNLTEPLAATAEATIGTLQATWQDQPIAIEGPATIRYANERIAIDRLIVRALESSVSLHGNLPLDADGDPGTLDVDARVDLAALAQYAPDDVGVQADGMAALVGTMKGSLRAIDPDLVLTLENATVTTPAVTPGVSGLRARVEIGSGEVRVPTFSAQWGSALLDATARAPFDLLPPDLPVALPRPGGPAVLRADLVNLDLATLPNAPDRLTGIISLHADLTASRPDLAALEGEVTLPDLTIRYDTLDLAQKGTSTVAFAGGIARVERFSLGGSMGQLDVQGDVELTGARAIDMTAAGNLNIAAVSAFTDEVRAEGTTAFEMDAAGTIAQPSLAGFVELTGGTIAVDDPQVAAQQLDARIDLTRERAQLTRLTGTLNGGTLSGSGFVAFDGDDVPHVNLRLVTEDVGFSAPLGLRSLSDADIRVVRRDNLFEVGGAVTIQEAGLTNDLNLDTGLLAAMTAPRGLDLTEDRNPLLERVRLDLGVSTASPIVVDNNLARAEVTTGLRVIGTPYETGMSGRLDLLAGSTITLNERRYQVERGTITFTEERRISPSFDLLLSTSAGDYDVTLEVTGAPGDTETVLTSNPALPETDIMALLVTGRTLDEMRGQEFEVAREQILSQLVGRVGSGLGRGLEQATGLSTVRIEPNLIANETDPSARMTIGQDLTDDLSLVYSTDLVNSSDRIWMAEYDVSRRFQTRVVRQADNTYRFDFQHDVRFGGQPEPSRQLRAEQTVRRVTVSGERGLDDAETLRIFDVEPGDAYDFFTVGDAVEDVEHAYLERGWLESRVSLARTNDADSVDLALTIDSGPQVELVYDGMVPPSDVQGEIRRQWHRGVFDTQRAGDALELLRGWLISENHLNPTLTYQIEELDPERRRVVFRTDPGVRFARLELVFEGASGIEPSALKDIIDSQFLDRQVFLDPRVVTELLERYYREQGYLVAEIDEPRYEYEGTLARVVMAVREGPSFDTGQVTMAGNDVLHTPGLLSEIPLVSGEPYLPIVAERSLDRIRDLYWARGYNDVVADYTLAADRDAGTVNVAFTIDEGPRTIVEDITVTGNEVTSTRLVRGQLEIQPEAPLDFAALGRSRRSLYDTGAFALVDIDREALERGAGEGSVPEGAAAIAGTDRQPIRVNVDVREVQPFQIQYGAFYDTERGPGGILDVSSHNSLGEARVIGVRSRYDAQLREARLYFNQPSLEYWPAATTGTVYYREERNPDTTGTNAFNVDRMGVSIQQERTLGNAYVWTYGYRFEQAHTFDPRPGGLLDQTVNVAPLTSSVTRETRDDVLDATQGAFLSHAFSFSPKLLGSDVRFLKYFGQYFQYIPLQPPRRKPLTNEVLRPRFVYAGGVRVGLAEGLGGSDVPLSERFFAGGSTTLRGFEQNAVGPIEPDGIPLGGEAMFVINNELRFPLFSIFDGVAFVDIGNVFRNVSDFSFTGLRGSGGVGLRIRTPWFLGRVDYGIPFDRRAGEPSSRVYFSIGQAF